MTYPSNPNTPIVNLSIGDYNVTSVPPQHLLSFSYDRVTKSEANTVTFTVFDETAILLEYQIAQGKDQVTFSYGYSGGPISKTYTATIQDYSIDFTPSGATLEVVAMTGGVAGFSQPKTATYTDMDIHDIVRELAVEEGWIIGTLEACKPVYSEEVDSSGNKKKKTFTRNNVGALQFIKNDLIPYAVSYNTGEGDYQIWFDDSQSKPVMYFSSLSMKNSLDSSKAKEEEEVAFYEFSWGTGGNSKVLSFKPNYSGQLAATKGAGTVDVSTIDKLSNEMFKVQYTKFNDPARPTSGSRSDVIPTKHMSIASNSSYSYDEAAKVAATMWYHASNLSYGAVLTTLGDPNLVPMSMISFLMVNRDGLPHHSSGVYIVTQITDTIENGSFTSTLQLLRNALSVGVDESGGVDISLNTDYTNLLGTPTSSPDNYTPSTQSGAGGGGSDIGNRLVEEAKKYLGVPYVWGGKTPSGFDCSGFTRYVYKQVTGKDIGVSTREQVNYGRAISKSEMQPGDIILNGNSSSNVSHVVMYIGNNQIIHAPRTGDVVKIANLYKGLDYPRRCI